MPGIPGNANITSFLTIKMKSRNHLKKRRGFRKALRVGRNKKREYHENYDEIIKWCFAGVVLKHIYNMQKVFRQPGCFWDKPFFQRRQRKKYDRYYERYAYGC